MTLMFSIVLAKSNDVVSDTSCEKAEKGCHSVMAFAFQCLFECLDTGCCWNCLVPYAMSIHLHM